MLGPCAGEAPRAQKAVPVLSARPVGAGVLASDQKHKTKDHPGLGISDIVLILACDTVEVVGRKCPCWGNSMERPLQVRAGAPGHTCVVPASPMDRRSASPFQGKSPGVGEAPAHCGPLRARPAPRAECGCDALGWLQWTCDPAYWARSAGKGRWGQPASSSVPAQSPSSLWPAVRIWGKPRKRAGRGRAGGMLQPPGTRLMLKTGPFSVSVLALMVSSRVRSL